MLTGLVIRKQVLYSSFAFIGGKFAKMSSLTYDLLRSDAKTAFCAAVTAVKPASLIRKAILRDGYLLRIAGKEITLKRSCYVVGFGKAVVEMALETERILGEVMRAGVVSVPEGATSTINIPSESRIQFLEGAVNNLPDEMAQRNAEKILRLAESLDADDTLLVLISGGGSALLPLPLTPITLNEKRQVIKMIANAGGSINQLNCVRKRLSRVKGGGLAAAAHPAKVVSLILSDVIGDPLDLIASGPTVANNDSPSAAWQVLCDFGIQNSVPDSIQEILQVEPEGKDLSGNYITNVIIGNSDMALTAAVKAMNGLGYSATALSSKIQGNVSDVADFYANIAFLVCEILVGSGSLLSMSQYLKNCFLWEIFTPNSGAEVCDSISMSTGKKGVCIISGGETTVKVTGSGIGGRNQELALCFAEKWRESAGHFENFKVALLSAGTDGIDGPTDAAGAFGYAEQLKCASDYKHFLNQNDSYSFYSTLNGGNDLIFTGHTGTNVMDIHILIIENLSF